MTWKLKVNNVPNSVTIKVGREHMGKGYVMDRSPRNVI